MSLADQTEDTFTVAADAQSGFIEISTNGPESVTVFIDDGAGGAPADLTVIAERYSNGFDRWMEYGRSSLTSNSNPQSVTDEAVPDKMRYSVVNNSGAEADFRLSGVSY
jgi:hypothetical protein